MRAWLEAVASGRRSVAKRRFEAFMAAFADEAAAQAVLAERRAADPEFDADTDAVERCIMAFDRPAT